MRAIKIDARASVGQYTQKICRLAEEGESCLMLISIGPKATNQSIKICADVLKTLRGRGMECCLDAGKDEVQLERGLLAHRVLLNLTTHANTGQAEQSKEADAQDKEETVKERLIKIKATTSVGRQTQEILRQALAYSGKSVFLLTSIGANATNQSVKVCAEVIKALRQNGRTAVLDAKKDASLVDEDRGVIHRMHLLVSVEGMGEREDAD